MAGMTIDFNNVRKQALYSYDKLAKTLNEAIEQLKAHDEQYMEIDPEDIQRDMDDLRLALFSIAGTSMENNDNFKDVSEEAEPIAWFNFDPEND